MSIAVSAVVQPSRSLAILLLGIGSGSFLTACLIGIGYVGHFPYPWRQVVSLPLFVIPVWAISCTIWHKKSLHIDISENGQIKVEEDKALAAQPRQDCLLQVRDDSKMVRLMPSSTLWPHLLLLRLQAQDRQVMNILILPDCMSADSFRALSVACRWIAAHNDHAER